MSIFSKFFSWVGSLFNSMKKVWNKLSDFEKQISVKASGIIAIINANINESPQVLFLLIQTKFPEVTKDKLQSYLTKASGVLGIADSTANLSFEDAVKAFQTYLGKQSGNKWVAVTQGAVGALLSVLSPDATPINKITVILEYVYQNFVKNKI